MAVAQEEIPTRIEEPGGWVVRTLPSRRAPHSLGVCLEELLNSAEVRFSRGGLRLINAR